MANKWNECKGCGHVNFTSITDQGNIWCSECNHLEPANMTAEPAGKPAGDWAKHDAAHRQQMELSNIIEWPHDACTKAVQDYEPIDLANLDPVQANALALLLRRSIMGVEPDGPCGGYVTLANRIIKTLGHDPKGAA